MEALSTPVTPPAVEQLVAQLQADCSEAQVELISDGFSRAGTQRNFTIKLVSKKQNLVSVCRVDQVNISKLCSKRSGAYVSTQIELSVDSPLTAATR